MKSRRLSVLVIIVVLFFGLLAWGLFFKPHPGAVMQAGIIPEVSGRPLQVLMAVPSGPVTSSDDTDTIVVSFNQPMAPLTVVPQDSGSGPLKFKPPVTGKYRWNGTATLVFTPDEKLPLSTEFEATVPKGAESLSGAKLDKDYTWKFETLRPAIVDHIPGSDEKWLSQRPNIYLYFNMPVTPERSKDYIELTDKSSEKANISIMPVDKEKLKKLRSDWAVENTLLVIPVQALKKGMDYMLQVSRGMTAKEGNLGTGANIFFTFTTAGEFKFTGMSGSDKPIDPEDSFYLDFTNPVKLKDLVKNIKFDPPVDLSRYRDNEDDDSNDELYLSVDLAPEKKYTLTISPELKDILGNRLGKEQIVNFKTAPYNPNLYMPTGLGVIEAYGDLRLSVGFVNIFKADRKAARIDKNNVIPLLKTYSFLGYGDYAEYLNYNSVAHLDYIQDSTWHLGIPKNKRLYLPWELKALLPADHCGFLYMKLSWRDMLNKKNGAVQNFVQVTNLGLTGKFAPENTLVWVTRMKDTAPVTGAKVQLRDDDNRVLWNGKTNSEGLCMAPGWAALGLKKRGEWYWSEAPRLWAFVEYKGDNAVISSDWGTGISPWQFDIAYEPGLDTNSDYAGAATSERGLYRAGETVHLKGAVRQKKLGKWLIPSLKTVNIKVSDSRDKVILKKNVKLSSFGTFDADVDIKPDAPTGYYNVGVSSKGAGEKDPLNVYCSFRVEAYVPTSFKVTVESPKEEYVFSDEYRGSVKGWFLFGAPMSDDNVEWNASLVPYDFTPKNREGYVFGLSSYLDWDSRDQTKSIGSGRGKLDAKGLMNIAARLDGSSFRGDASLSVEATVTTKDRESLSGNADYVIHRGDYCIGLKLDNYFVQANKKVQAKIVTCDFKGKSLPGKSLKVKVFERIWNSVRKVGLEGRLEWQTEKQDNVIEEAAVKTGKDGGIFEFMPKKPGLYYIEIEGKDTRGNTIITSDSFYSWGDGYIPWERTDDDRIELVRNKNKYAPGDTALIMVKSPYEKAKALVTVEREYIIDRFIVELKGSADVVKIPIKEDYLPNVYVSVVLLNGRTPAPKFNDIGEDLGKPTFKIGYVELPVTPDDKRLKVSVKSDKETYRPGGTVVVDIDVRDAGGKGVPAEVTLIAADVGVLSLIDFKTPDFFDSFYGERPLSVLTSESLLHIIGQRNYSQKGENTGGGGGIEGGDRIFRKKMKSTAYWNPSIKTNNNGKARVSFTLPDNLTTFRLMAIAITRDSLFGSGENTFIVNKPLLIRGAMPRFFRPGDRCIAGITVHNGTKRDGTVTVDVSVKGVILEGENKKVINVKGGQEQEVTFSFYAKSPGDAVFKFYAKMGKETDGLEMTVPVEKHTMKIAAASIGVTKKSTEEQILVPPDVVPDAGGLDVTASGSSLVNLKGAVDYLMEYPYGCLEQRLSKIAPKLLDPDFIKILGMDDKGIDKFKKLVQSSLNELYQFQKSDGGFGYWTDDPSDEYITAYALQVFKRADDMGYRVDKSSIKRALKYLRNRIGDKDNSYDEYYRFGVKTSLMYALAYWGAGDESKLSYLFEHRNEMPLFGRAFLMKACHYMKKKNMEDTLAVELLNNIKVSPRSAHFEEQDNPYLCWLFSSNVRTSAIILESLLSCDYEFPQAPLVASWLIDKQENGRWINTQENCYAVFALNEYYMKYEKEVPNFNLKVFLSGDRILEGAIKGYDSTPLSAEVPMIKIKKGTSLPVVFDKKGKGMLKYSMCLKYSTVGKVIPSDEGFTVLRVIRDLDTGVAVMPGKDMELGKTYVVTLYVLTPQERSFVVLDDPLPAGFEVVNTTFATAQKSQIRKLSAIERKDDEESDRWWYWGTFNHWEIYDDRVLLFANSLYAGEHTYSYMVKAMRTGAFFQPETKAEEMYNPEVFGNTGSGWVRIR
ncbi:MAG: Ig-like domain-containing protein [Chloroflexi bacterium]|nr:Ig-like domain-containing protein [Chloroflexota bacterium]